MKVSISKKILGLAIIIMIVQLFIYYNIIRIFDDIKINFIENIRKIKEFTILETGKSINEISKEVIKNIAQDTANEIEDYLINNPKMTVEDLYNDEFFQTISVKPVGKTGFTAVADYNSLIVLFHKIPGKVGYDLHNLKDRYPELYELKLKSKGGNETAAFYKWTDENEQVRDKYAYTAIVNQKTADNVGMSVSATTYLDEFYEPSVILTSQIDEIINNSLIEIELMEKQTKATLYLFFILALLFLIILTILISKMIVRPILALKEAVIKVSDEKLDTIIKLDSNDEFGELAAHFNKMTDKLKIASKKKENYYKVLDKGVRERTKELEKAKNELENTVLERTHELEKAKNELENTVLERTHELEKAKKSLEQKNQELEETLEDFYTIRLSMQKQMEKGIIEEENKKIKEKLDDLKK